VAHIQEGLNDLLILARSLTLQGPGSWWEEAKQRYPLLLVQGLMATAHVSMVAGSQFWFGKDI
jgi:hypothetical protein